MNLATFVGTRTQITRQRIQCMPGGTSITKLEAYLTKLQLEEARARKETSSNLWHAITNEIGVVEALIKLEQATGSEGEVFNTLLGEICGTEGSNFVDQVETHKALREYDRPAFQDGTDEHRMCVLEIQLLTSILNHESARKMPSNSPKLLSVV